MGWINKATVGAPYESGENKAASQAGKMEMRLAKDALKHIEQFKLTWMTCGGRQRRRLSEIAFWK